MPETITHENDEGQAPRDLQGSTVLAFESRLAAELENLIRRHGGVPIVVPSIREVPLQENVAALAFLRLEPDHPKMGSLVAALARRGPPQLETKTSSAPIAVSDLSGWRSSARRRRVARVVRG